MNIGISKKTFIKIFSFIPKRPIAGNIVTMDYDFKAIDKIMPHPVYAWMTWICVLNPSKKTFEMLKPLIDESYDLAKKKVKIINIRD